MDKLERPLCIYHGNCQDGFAAAWAVRRGLGPHVEFVAGVYQDPPPDVTGRSVIMVDFSYKHDVLAAMAKIAKTIVILDHHESAAEDLSEWVISEALPNRSVMNCFKDMARTSSNIIAEFDMERSGAGLAWDYFVGGERPMLLDMVEDRDLWKFHYRDTRAAVAALFSYPYDFDVYDRLMQQIELPRLIIEGEGIERKHHKDVDELVQLTLREMRIGGAMIPVANVPHTLTSDAGYMMARQNITGMAACYWDTPNGRVFSLRSTNPGPNCAVVAKQYGGGGHAHAAGFRMPIGWEGDYAP